MKKSFGWPAEFFIFLCVMWLSGMAFALSPSEIAMNNLMQYAPTMTAGDVPVMVRPGVYGPSGVKGTNVATAAQLATKANSSDVSALIGSISNSYVLVNGDVVPFSDFNDERPAYESTHGVYFDSGVWNVSVFEVGQYTNPSQSYLPPLTGWLDATGGVANITVEWFSGQDNTKLDKSFTNTLTSAYGSVYIHDGTNTVNLTTTNYTLVSMWMTNATQSRATPVNCVAMTNGIRVLVSGDYNVSYSLSMLGQNNSVLEAGLFVDGVHQDSSEFNRKISTGADVGSASAVGQLSLTSNQVVNVGRISDVDGAYTIVQGQLVLSRIGGVLSAGAEITQTVTSETNTVPSNAAVESALMKAAPDKWLVVGDSGSALLAYAEAGEKWPELVSELIPNISVTNMAVGGNTVSNQIERLPLFTNFFTAATYDVATIMLGPNDFGLAGRTTEEQYTDYTNLVALLYAAGADTICIIPYYGYRSESYDIAGLNVLLRGFAASNQISFVESATEKLNLYDSDAVNTNYCVGGTNFNYHLNETGNRILAEQVYGAFLDGFRPASMAVSLVDVQDSIASKAAKSQRVNLTGILQLSGATVGTAPIGSSFRGIKHSTNAQNHVMLSNSHATNVIVSCQFGYVDPAITNNGVSLQIGYRTITSSNTVLTTTILNTTLSATNGANGTITNDLFLVSAAIPATHLNNRGGQLLIYTANPSSGGLDTYATNGIWFLAHEADVVLE